MPTRGSVLHYFQCGAKLGLFECAVLYLAPALLHASTAGPLRSFLWHNAAVQLGLFAAAVHLPAGLSGHMAYVDMGWPLGLVLAAAQAYAASDGIGDPARRLFACGGLFLHGGRLAAGAVAVFGSRTHWRYRFDEDLPRYRSKRAAPTVFARRIASLKKGRVWNGVLVAVPCPAPLATLPARRLSGVSFYMRRLCLSPQVCTAAVGRRGRYVAGWVAGQDAPRHGPAGLG